MGNAVPPPSAPHHGMEKDDMKLFRTLGILLLALGALATQAAFAHGGGKPRHGGTVAVASGISFELVAAQEGATLHLLDHDKPMATAGMSGKLTVLQGTQKTEADLKPDGDNRLRATGIQIRSGAKVVAVLNGAGGKPLAVRFTVR
jgi:hypothetical protein